ncbi:MAG: RnfABCDGE type electron transport complex subunit B [Sedimentibacter sp.]|uniref:RnfABCDGE type electron transport complex subunit B n=1 Tax=Sedimentibacter sp. TaxID=1960295 RepID=UPI0029824190|nr:RnfABCDGE type electron transport complex subunit B [Sedimentibacter sp.]MDW5300597.1 RnfABCDGE type electron transport complex subunit B [Sedimentibacter sp.]
MVIVSAAAVTGGIGIVCGVLLAVAAKLFEVEVDQKVIDIRNALPGANCGACGFAGCDAMANAIASGKAPANGCPVANKEAHEKIAAIMGVKAETSEKKVAHVMCQGCDSLATKKYDFSGVHDCKAAAAIAGGDKSCQWGCLGYGNCVAVCAFDAIKIVDGVAVIDKEKCTACGKCIEECPKGVIELVPYKNSVIVGCHNKDFGKAVKDVCSVGCIGCKICEKNCAFDAIHVIDNLARIDYDKCTHCMVCVEKCPTKAIQGDLSIIEKSDK